MPRSVGVYMTAFTIIAWDLTNSHYAEHSVSSHTRKQQQQLHYHKCAYIHTDCCRVCSDMLMRLSGCLLNIKWTQVKRNPKDDSENACKRHIYVCCIDIRICICMKKYMYIRVHTMLLKSLLVLNAYVHNW